MGVLSFTERMFVGSMFRDRMPDLCGDAFERFFDRLMIARYPDFVEVGTHGNIDDLSAEGLHARGLQADAGDVPARTMSPAARLSDRSHPLTTVGYRTSTEAHGRG